MDKSLEDPPDEEQRARHICLERRPNREQNAEIYSGSGTPACALAPRPGASTSAPRPARGMTQRVNEPAGISTHFQSSSGLSGHELCTHASCGREPALPAFSKDAHPLHSFCAVSCLHVLQHACVKSEIENFDLIENNACSLGVVAEICCYLHAKI